jgi:HAD superfamily hydrolase (TIGR01509 family)
MSTLQALLWDVDGTLAESERDGHLVAFNRAFAEHKVAWHWTEARYGELLRITGGRERLLHDMQQQPSAPSIPSDRDALARALHARKNKHYAALIATGAVPLRPGVMELLQSCRQRGVQMAITTTTSRVNVDALLRTHLGLDWATWFGAVVCGEDVRAKKPDPEVYTLALKQLQLSPLQVVALEDSPGGVAAARAADCPVIVTRSVFFADAPIEGALAIGPGLHDRQGWRPSVAGREPGCVTLDDIAAWAVSMDTVSDYP